MKKLLSALTIAVGLVSQPAAAGDTYVGVELLGLSAGHDFGGYNTLGAFSNNDSVRKNVGGIALTFGMRDRFNLGGMAITPEIDLAWYQKQDITSASFPGAPNPFFFYQTSVSTGRLGVNFWTPFHSDSTWRAEAGAGLGMLYRDMSTGDGVVAGTGDDYAIYGKLGVRAIRSMGQNGNLTIGLNYVFADETDVALTDFNPAGNFSFRTQGPEISIGYQLSIGK